MFCPNCGASVQGRFCAKCGTAVDAATAPAGAATPGAHSYAAPSATAGAMAPNVAGALAYLVGLSLAFFFWYLRLITRTNSSGSTRFSRSSSTPHGSHLDRGDDALHDSSLGLSTLLSLLGMLLSLAFLVLWIVMMVKAYQGERFKLPIIGDLAEKQA